MKTPSRLLVGCLALLGLGLTTQKADAGFQVTLRAGADFQTFVDSDNDGLIGVTSADVGGYRFTFTATMSNTPGGPTLAFVSASQGFAQDIGGGATTISVYASANGFTQPNTLLYPISVNSGATFQNTANSTSSANVSYAAYYDSGNALTDVATGTVIGSEGPVFVPPNTLNTALTDSQILNSVSTPYAINLLLQAEMTGSGGVLSFNGTANLTPTPAPAGVILLASAIPVLGLRRVFRRKAVVA